MRLCIKQHGDIAARHVVVDAELDIVRAVLAVGNRACLERTARLSPNSHDLPSIEYLGP